MARFAVRQVVPLAVVASALGAAGCGPSGDETSRVTVDSTVETTIQVLPADSSFPLNDGAPPDADDFPAPEPETGPGRCDPNYQPCVPIASDVDCAGGGGNGPAYVQGPVRVVGRDVYGLDRDGDGIGCEN
jgi:hypothetical protein